MRKNKSKIFWDNSFEDKLHHCVVNAAGMFWNYVQSKPAAITEKYDLNVENPLSEAEHPAMRYIHSDVTQASLNYSQRGHARANYDRNIIKRAAKA